MGIPNPHARYQVRCLFDGPCSANHISDRDFVGVATSDASWHHAQTGHPVSIFDKAEGSTEILSENGDWS
jgi:hypothetical protein